MTEKGSRKVFWAMIFCASIIGVLAVAYHVYTGYGEETKQERLQNEHAKLVSTGRYELALEFCEDNQLGKECLRKTGEAYVKDYMREVFSGRVTTHIQEPTLERIQEVADKTGVSLNLLVREKVDYWLGKSGYSYAYILVEFFPDIISKEKRKHVAEILYDEHMTLPSSRFVAALTLAKNENLGVEKTQKALQAVYDSAWDVGQKLAIAEKYDFHRQEAAQNYCKFYRVKSSLTWDEAERLLQVAEEYHVCLDDVRPIAATYVVRLLEGSKLYEAVAAMKKYKLDYKKILDLLLACPSKIEPANLVRLEMMMEDKPGKGPVLQKDLKRMAVDDTRVFASFLSFCSGLPSLSEM